MYTVGTIIDFQHDFQELMEAQGIRDPFVAERENFSRHVKYREDGGMSVDLDATRKSNKVTRAEKDAWIIAENEYIAMRTFNEIGYEEFLLRTKKRDYYDIGYLRDRDEFVPCRSVDGQCMLMCKNFGGDCSFLAETTGA